MILLQVREQAQSLIQKLMDPASSPQVRKDRHQNCYDYVNWSDAIMMVNGLLITQNHNFYIVCAQYYNNLIDQF